MNHYQKLAIVVIRVFSCCLIAYSFVCVVYSLLFALISRTPLPPGSSSNTLAFIIVGVTLFALSKRLGAFIAKGL